MEASVGVHLAHAGERVDEVSALASHLGGRVGLEGVLADLNRTAVVTTVPGKAPAWGFRWDAEDSRSQRWFPQGITTSADQGGAEEIDGRQVVCTSWYSQDISGLDKGARVTFVDVTSRFEARRGEYYDRLLAVSTEGAWDRWVHFFATGIMESAKLTHRQMLGLVGAQEVLKELVRASNLRADREERECECGDGSYCQAPLHAAAGHECFLPSSRSPVRGSPPLGRGPERPSVQRDLTGLSLRPQRTLRSMCGVHR